MSAPYGWGTLVTYETADVCAIYCEVEWRADPYQNPLYPADNDLTIPQMEALARDRSMTRARSPGELRCIIDSVSSLNVPEHTHTYFECMNYRHLNVIGDDDPWNYWMLYDDWAARQPGEPYPPPPVPPPVGWYPSARLNPTGISYFDHIVYIGGFSFYTEIDPAHVRVDGGISTRVTFQGVSFTIYEAYIGPILTPGIALTLHQLTFNGQPSVTVSGYNFETVSDPLPFGLDGSHGLHVSGYIITEADQEPPPWGTTGLGILRGATGWISKARFGEEYADDLDKTSDEWLTSAPGEPEQLAAVGVLMVEGYYPPPPEVEPLRSPLRQRPPPLQRIRPARIIRP